MVLEFEGLVAHAIENVEVMLEDRTGLLKGVVRVDTTVGPDFENELIIIGNLSDAGVFNGILDEANRREKRIDRDNPDGLLLFLVLLAGIVSATGLNLDFSLEGGVFLECRDHLIGVNDGDIGIRLDVSGGDSTSAVLNLDGQSERLAFQRNDENFLQVEDDVSDIFDDPINALELVLNTLDFDRGDSGTLDRAQKNATQRIADGVSITGFEGLGDELGVGWRGAFLNLGEFIGQFELSEAFGHGGE